LVSSKQSLEFDTQNRQSATGTTVLRILSIEKDAAKDCILFLAINKDRNFLFGTIDKHLVTNDMLSDSMIECLTNDIIDSTDGIYIGLSKQTNDFVKVINDNPSFPKVRDLISKIQSIIQSIPHSEQELRYIVEGVIIQDPQQEKLSQNEIGTKVLLRDNSGMIPLNLGGNNLNKFANGDKVLVIDGFEQEWNTLSIGTYGSITKTATVDLTDPTTVFPNKVYFKHLKVGTSITQDKITAILHAVDFTPYYTRVFLTIDNEGKEEISFFRTDTIAIQNKRQYITREEQQFRGINSPIPSGIKETGMINFEPLDSTEPMASFRFRILRETRKLDFTFTIYIPY
jgi:hypothetical protein